MKLKLDFEFPPLSSSITHGDRIVLLGSCFSDSMSAHFSNAGFHVLSNPFGTLFHPTSIANTIIASLSDSPEVNVLKRDDVYFSWDSGSKIFAYSKEELVKLILAERQKLKETLLNSKLLVVTFGTALGYRNTKLDILVGNCHKQPGTDFKKELSSIKELRLKWNEVLSLIENLKNKIQIVYTVSPVRHKKDGLIENNRSKARLIEFCNTNDATSYFPSYEIVIDELRDYRFYTSDLVHPNDEAIEYVWERFNSYAFNNGTIDLIDKISNVKSLLNHRSLHPKSKADQARLEKGQTLKKSLLEANPEVYWK